MKDFFELGGKMFAGVGVLFALFGAPILGIMLIVISAIPFGIAFLIHTFQKEL